MEGAIPNTRITAESAAALCKATTMAAPPAPSIAAEGNGSAAVHHGHSRRHALLFLLLYQGHINPMFRLAGVLHRRGFAITVFHAHFHFAETASGIAGSGVPFLWVVRPGMVTGCSRKAASQLPVGFEAATRGRGMVVAWAPQEEVLRHRAVGGFWTHGGWNSTTESVCEGVPMLCRPYFGDQMGNARYVEHVWRVGLELRGELERGRVEAAIRRLITGEDGAEMRARAGELKKAAAECTGQDGLSSMAIDKLVTHIMSL